MSCVVGEGTAAKLRAQELKAMQQARANCASHVVAVELHTDGQPRLSPSGDCASVTVCAVLAGRGDEDEEQLANRCGVSRIGRISAERLHSLLALVFAQSGARLGILLCNPRLARRLLELLVGLEVFPGRQISQHSRDSNVLMDTPTNDLVLSGNRCCCFSEQRHVTHRAPDSIVLRRDAMVVGRKKALQFLKLSHHVDRLVLSLVQRILPDVFRHRANVVVAQFRKSVSSRCERIEVLPCVLADCPANQELRALERKQATHGDEVDASSLADCRLRG